LNRDLATIWVLVRRDLVRFFRQRSRVLGAFAQPILFWLLIGGGLSGSFAIPGSTVGYQEYFFPGVVLMIVLFTSIFSTMSLIEDRHAGFLQAVLAAPSSRLSIVLGKTLGGLAIALAQALLLLVALPWAGYPYDQIDWPMALAILATSALALCALGFAIAWWLDSIPGYHAVMSVLLIPAWILSGAMFPASRAAPWLQGVMRWNPLGWAVDGLRAAFYGGAPPSSLQGMTGVVALGATACFGALTLGLAAWACSRQT
jgi:daunorubicin resistance ABC transporter membrane protein